MIEGLKNIPEKAKLADDQLDNVVGGAMAWTTELAASYSIEHSDLPQSTKDSLMSTLRQWSDDPNKEYSIAEVNTLLRKYNLREM